MPALPASIRPVPPTRIQLFELLFGVSKMGVAGFQNFGRRSNERLLGGDPIDPALLGKLFMVGKTEAKEKFYSFVRCRLFGFILGLAFALGFGFVFFRFGGYKFCVWRAITFTLEFIEKLLVQSKSLLPGFQFVPGELGLLLVLAKIKLHVNVGHRFSLWRARPGVKTRRGDAAK